MNPLYESAYGPPPSAARRLLLGLWTAAGLAGLIAFAWAEPWSALLFARLAEAGVPEPWLRWAGVPLVMALRAVVLVESFGYVYHRFFQHVGWLTRRAGVFRRNQRYHWIHHMIIYPIGRLYKRAAEYVAAEEGVAWSWAAPVVLGAGLFFASHGLTLGSLVFVAAVALYAKGVVDLTHERFHLAEHPWTGRPYFVRLEEIHVLHHWDQRTNFTIVHPLMDVLFGTYRSPDAHRRELAIALRDEELTVSDLLNWRYLLVEATPAEYAAFVSAARRHPRSLRKVGLFMEEMTGRLARAPEDGLARTLLARAAELIRACAQESGREGAPVPAGR